MVITINDLISKHMLTNETKIGLITKNGESVSGFYHSDVIIPYLNRQLKSCTVYDNNSVVAVLK